MKMLLSKVFVLMAGCAMLQNVNAVSINVGFDGIGNPTLDLLSLSTGAVLDAAVVTDWSLFYDDAAGSGVLTIAATSAKAGVLTVNSTSLTAHTNGSLHIEGTVGFVGATVPAFSFVGDMVVDVVTSDTDQTTIFTLNPRVLSGQDLPGFLLTDFIDEEPSPFIGDIFNFQLSSSLLAIADSPFPVYSPVPVPAAVWLLGSGLLGLAAVGRKKTHNSRKVS